MNFHWQKKEPRGRAERGSRKTWVMGRSQELRKEKGKGSFWHSR